MFFRYAHRGALWKLSVSIRRPVFDSLSLGVYATGTIMPAVLRFNLFDDFCSKILNHAWIYVLLGIDKPYPNNVWFYIKNLNPTVKFGSVL